MPAADPAPKVDIYMPWYVKDYLAATRLFSTLEHGAYLLLLAQMWLEGGTLPLEHDRLARVANVADPEAWAAIWKVISVKFQPAPDQPGRITQRKLEEVLEHSRALKAAATDRGRAGADARWGRGRKPRRARPVPPAPQPEPAPEPAPAPPPAHAEPMLKQCLGNALQSASSPVTDPDPERAHAQAIPEPDAGAWPEPKPEPVRFNHGTVRARGQPPLAPPRQLQLVPAAERLCDFHAHGANKGRPAIPPRQACAQCRQVGTRQLGARASPRPADTPKSTGEILGAGGWPPREPAAPKGTDREEGRA